MLFVDWLVGSVYIPEYKERKREFDFLVKKKFADTHTQIHLQTNTINEQQQQKLYTIRRRNIPRNNNNNKCRHKKKKNLEREKKT